MFLEPKGGLAMESLSWILVMVDSATSTSSCYTDWVETNDSDLSFLVAGSAFFYFLDDFLRCYLTSPKTETPPVTDCNYLLYFFVSLW
jgi:hypothetical protein